MNTEILKNLIQGTGEISSTPQKINEKHSYTGWGISNATEDLNRSEENINDSGFFFFSENGNTGPS